MKTILKSILILSVCALFIISCKTENDLGGKPVPVDIVSFERYGMKAYFPENDWEYRTYLIDMKGFERECATAFLNESAVIIDNKPKYSVNISFMRFISTFENEAKANEIISAIKESYTFHYPSVSDITLTKINNYEASAIKSKTPEDFIDESFFIYHKERLYWICMIMPENKVKDYYSECMEIVNTLEITE